MLIFRVGPVPMYHLPPMGISLAICTPILSQRSNRVAFESENSGRRTREERTSRKKGISNCFLILNDLVN